MANSKYSQKAINKYQKDKYYRASVTFPKEYKEELEKAAESRGVSVSRFISDLVGRELGINVALDGVLPTLKGRSDQPGPAAPAGSSDGLGDGGEIDQPPEK